MSKRRRTDNSTTRKDMDSEKGSGDSQKAEVSSSQDFSKKPKKVKTEDGAESEDIHSHEFYFKWKSSDDKYKITCDHPQTVLQAIKSRESIDWDEDKLVLCRGEARLGPVIATHFPCTCLEDEELITGETKTEQVEVRETKGDYSVQQNEQYYVVNIKTKGGTNTRTKILLRYFLLTKYPELCVYGKENMTIREAIKHDGRFVELGDFKLEYSRKEKTFAFSDDKIQTHNGETFYICLPRDTAETSDTETEALFSEAPMSVSAAPIWTVMAPPRLQLLSDILDQIQTEQTEPRASSRKEQGFLKLLRGQFPHLKKHLLKRYKVKLTQEDYGKAQQAFSEVDRLEKLLHLSKSVCKVRVGDTCSGTGFVLFKNYILTSSHLFDEVRDRDRVQPDVNISAIFNYKEPHQKNTLNFKVRNRFIDSDREIDYAVLELVEEQDKGPVPPGLIKYCRPMPERGEACIIGHPNGDVKKFDPICIIEKKKRKKEVDLSLQRLDDMFAFSSVWDHVQNQSIERIWSPSDPQYYQQLYNTFMFHGSSGSPVFDGECRVFGMHSGGFTYDRPTKGSVIEYARPLQLILSQFVTKIKYENNSDLLKAVEEEAKNNPYVKQILT